VVGERGLNMVEFNIGNFIINSQSDFVVHKEQKAASKLVLEFGCYIFLIRDNKAVLLSFNH